MSTDGASASRPTLTAALTGRELSRWYWLRSELVVLARSMGVSTSGGKEELTARLVAFLDGDAPVPVRKSDRPRLQPLPEPLTRDTQLPAGQRCTQQLREFLTAEIGSSFRFDGAMRQFIGNGTGSTLGDAIVHWYATRSAPRAEIGRQFEFNQFVRDWHRRHPGTSGGDAVAEWKRYRATPIDAR